MKTSELLLTAIMMLVAVTANGAETLDGMRQEAERMHAEGKNDSAISMAQRALDVATSQSDTVAIIGINSSLGVYLRTQGKLDEALRHYNSAMQLCTSKSFKNHAGEDARQEAASLYVNLATLHIDMQHKKEALYYAGKAAEWAVRLDDKELKTRILTQDGLIFLMCGDNREAARLLSMSYEYAMQLKLYSAALNAGAYMIVTANRSGDKAAADTWRSRCRQIEGKVTDVMALIAYYQIQCSVALSDGKWSDAIALFNRILSTEGVDSMQFVVYDCYNNMHEAWAKLGDWRKAYDCLGRATSLKDSLFEADKAESMRELTVRYQTKEKELALERSRAALSQTRMYMALAALAVAVCAAIAYIYVQSQRRKAREKEAEYARLKADTDKKLTQRYIDGLENERCRLAKELHDGVCNSLYTAQLMVSKQGGEGAERLSGTLEGIRRQVRQVSHELMPPEFRYADICAVIDDYLSQTAESAACDITFTHLPDGADWQTVADTKALEIYRITQEAVANALKHSKATTIAVALTMSGGTVTLEVADNGTPAERTQGGIGRRTMKQRADAAGGKIETLRRDGLTIIRLTVGIR